MRILVTADLHYDIQRSRGPTEALAKKACALGGDAIVLVGDTAGRDTQQLRTCLQLFKGFGGQKLFVPGNHCLWCIPDENSLERYNKILPKVVAEEGFIYLDDNPQQYGAVGIAGSIVWYDYSFQDTSLEIPEAFYRSKISPGAAAHFDEHRHLLESYRRHLQEHYLELTVRWMDGAYVRLPMSDEVFVGMLADKLSRQIDELSKHVEKIAVFMHHLPFRQLVPANRPSRFAFAAAYMGAERLGKILLACPKVTHVYCGHSHWPKQCRIGHIKVVNIGSTYVEKKLKFLKL